MSMTKKDYELIATSLKESWNDAYDFDFNEVELQAMNQMMVHAITNLGTSLGAENPLFSFNKFVKTCGLDSFEAERGGQLVSLS